MNIMPNEYEKDCDNDASNGTTAEIGQTNIFFRPGNEEHRLSQKSFASHFRFQWWAHSEKKLWLDLWASLRRA